MAYHTKETQTNPHKVKRLQLLADLAIRRQKLKKEIVKLISHDNPTFEKRLGMYVEIKLIEYILNKSI